MAWAFTPFNDEQVVARTTFRQAALADLLRDLNFTEKEVVQAEQVHADQVAIAAEGQRGRVIPGQDALITKQKGLPLVIRTADCVPVFIFCQKLPAVGLVHAGRKGTLLNIVTKTLAKMNNAWQVKPADCKVALGPGIKKCCYEIDPVTHEHFDLYAVVREQLKGLGIKAQDIIESAQCTACRTDLFYSYRKEGDTGRLFSLMMLK